MLITCTTLDAFAVPNVDPQQHVIGTLPENSGRILVTKLADLLFKTFIFDFFLFGLVLIVGCFIENKKYKYMAILIACLIAILSFMTPSLLSNDRRYQNNLDMYSMADTWVRLSSAFAITASHERQVENAFHAFLDINVINYHSYYYALFSLFCISGILILVMFDAFKHSGIVNVEEKLFRLREVFNVRNGWSFVYIIAFLITAVLSGLIGYFVNKKDKYVISDKVLFSLKDKIRTKSKTRFYHAQFAINGVAPDGINGATNINTYEFNYNVLMLFICNLLFYGILVFFHFSLDEVLYNQEDNYKLLSGLLCFLVVIGCFFGYTIVIHIMDCNLLSDALDEMINSICQTALPCFQKPGLEILEMSKVDIKSAQRFSMHPFTMELVYQNVDRERYFLMDVTAENDGREIHVVPENWLEASYHIFAQLDYDLSDEDEAVLVWITEAIRYGDLKIGVKYNTDQIIEKIAIRRISSSPVQRMIGDYELSEVYDKICRHFYYSDIILFTGNTGSGKSTTLNAIFSLLPESLNTTKITFVDGTVTDVKEAGYVYGSLLRQNSDEVAITLSFDQILDAAEADNPGSDIRNTFIRFIKEAGIYQTYVMNPGVSIAELMSVSSGGQRQQWAITVFLVKCMARINKNGNPRLYAFDEAVSSIDKTNAKRVLRDIIKLLSKHGPSRNTILLVLHHFDPLMEIVEESEGSLKVNRLLVSDGTLHSFVNDGDNDHITPTNTELEIFIRERSADAAA
jgi:energy-coupling factor transporter ATP-binding protein EcfA2